MRVSRTPPPAPEGSSAASTATEDPKPIPVRQLGRDHLLDHPARTTPTTWTASGGPRSRSRDVRRPRRAARPPRSRRLPPPARGPRRRNPHFPASRRMRHPAQARPRASTRPPIVGRRTRSRRCRGPGVTPAAVPVRACGGLWSDLGLGLPWNSNQNSKWRALTFVGISTPSRPFENLQDKRFTFCNSLPIPTPRSAQPGTLSCGV